MSKFEEEFIEQFRDTECVRRQTKQFREEYKYGKGVKRSATEVTKPTPSKLGKIL